MNVIFVLQSIQNETVKINRKCFGYIMGEKYKMKRNIRWRKRVSERGVKVLA